MILLKARPGLCALATLVALGGCGGGADSNTTPAPAPARATRLAYTDPAPSPGAYRLVKNPASAGGHLILDLMGPAAGTAMGAAITLSVDVAKATWVDVLAGGTTALLMQNGTQFDLGSGMPILKATATEGVLQAALAQKNLTAAAPLNGTLLRVALDLKPSAELLSGTPITLAAGTTCQVLDGAGNLPSITVTVGSLVAQ